jgi:hypothetical protein
MKRLLFPLLAAAGVLAVTPSDATLAATVKQVSGPTPNAQRLVDGQRLSAWMLARPGSPNDFLAGTSWQVDAQKKVQAAERSALLLYMVNPPFTGSGKPPADTLMHWLEQLPITGRVPIPSADARWLQIHPESDPLLDPLDRVVVPSRPSQVVVLTPEGERCVLPHVPGFSAADYVNACSLTRDTAGDVAYLTQPDGRVKRVPIAIWNREPQVEPGPGAWIFAPPTQGPWNPDLAFRLMTFIGTQGPAPDSILADPDSVASNVLPHAPLSTRAAAVSASDWGVTGLLQTPTARMRETGSVDVTYSRVAPYSRANFIFQPFDWFEAGFRYTTLSNQRYGVVAGSNQPYADKSVDVKVRLLEESRYQPAVAVGMRDIGGTGLFSGEYLVANKRFGDFDASLGLGWGNVGARGDLGNPLSIFSSGFSNREANPNSGQLSFHDYFHGRTAPFAGVSWQSPYDPVSVKVEYDGNNYRHEPFDTVLPVSSPINVGVVYQYSPNLDVTVGLERGNTAMFSVSFHAPLNKLSQAKFADPAPVPIGPTRPYYVDQEALNAATPDDQRPDFATRGTTQPAAPVVAVPASAIVSRARDVAVRPSDPARGALALASSPVDWAKTARDIQFQTGWRVADIRPDGHDLRVTFANPDSVYWRGLVNRALAVLHRDAPSEFDRFRLVFTVHGVAMTEFVVFRDYWVEEQTSYQAPQDKRQSLVVMAPHSPDDVTPLFKSEPSRFSGGVGLSYAQTVGGPDNLLLWQIGAEASGEFHITEHVWGYGALNYRLLDNYNNFTYDAPSNLPRVRTDIREYLEASRLTMPNLQLTALDRFGPDQFYTMYAGYLEPMFAGVGGEYLYRPDGSSLAFGVDANEVKQRGFKEDFSLMPYHAFTGFATAYWQTGWHQVLASLAVGQYLAKDRGATLNLSRQFNNGVVVGAYATKTNISAATFGEGSFDKGIYLAIPFDALLGRSTGYMAPLRYVPVLRDGGQMLDRAFPLYDLTNLRNPRTLDLGPPPADGSSSDGP